MNEKERRVGKPVRPAIRYSEAFKLAVVREVEGEGLPCQRVQRKYGIEGGATVNRWVRQYGNGSRGKIIRVEQPKEINENKALKQRVKRLEKLLADANLDLALEKAYTLRACERAGIQDVEAFKKKIDGGRHI